MNSLKLKFNLKGEWATFLFCFFGALAIFIPFLIVDKGFFIYCGDFNSQQIPFYYYVNDFFKNFTGQYSWQTDLGGSIINSYSFYLIGSPFFWISALFPPSISPFLMVPMYALKFGVTSVGAFLFLKRYCKQQNFAILGAVLYAFSGSMIYNVFFNHFLDCIALFPFMLWALDCYIFDERKGAFAFVVALNLLNNYFFFFGEIVFLFIYFFVRMLSKDFRMKPKKFLGLCFESLLGVGVGCLLLLPAILSLKDNPRTLAFNNGFNLLVYWESQQYFAILSSLFLPPDPAYLPSIFTKGAIKWTSLSAFLPIVGVSGVTAFMRAKKRCSLNRILYVCLIMALVPILNSSFIMFNSSYYARWYYMPLLIMCLTTVLALGSTDTNIIGSIKIVGGITLAFLAFALVPTLKDEVWKIGASNDALRTWLNVVVAILMLLVFGCIVYFYRKKPQFAPYLICAVLGASVFYGILHISIGKFPQWEGDRNYVTQTYDTARNNTILPKDEFYRTNTYGTKDNIGLWSGIPNISFFNSTITPSIMEFYPSVGVKRDVSSKPEPEKYALATLLSTKYYIASNEKRPELEEKITSKGWEYLNEDKAFTYFENTHFVPMGIAYDKYVTEENFEKTSNHIKGNLLIRGVLLSEEQIEKFSHLLYEETNIYNLTYDTFKEDVKLLQDTTCYDFVATQKGLTAKINLYKESLVFFSVPYDKGFKAYVDGKLTEIEKVNNGLSAIIVPEGYSEIEFVYSTPGFNTALLVTISSILVFLIYMLIIRKNKKVGQK